MKSPNTRILCALLAALVLTSCGSGSTTDKTPETTADTTAETEVETEPDPNAVRRAISDDLPDTDMDGYTYRVLSRQRDDFIGLDLEQNGDVVNDAIYNRNLTVSDRFNCKYEATFTDSIDTTGINTITAGDDAFDVMLCQIVQIPKYATTGYFRDWYEDMPHVNLDKPWYIGNAAEALSVKGHAYAMIGEYDLDVLRFTYCMYYNQDISDEYNLENIYDVVNDGRWTYDKLYEYANTVYVDLDGNGTKDENDRLTVSWGGEAYMNAMEKAYELFHSPSVYMEDERHTATIFTEGRSLFMHGFFLAVDTLEEMEDDYAVLPIPKTSETQDGYLCANYDVMMFVMPRFVTDTELYGAVTEWLSYEGLSHVRDAYVETTLKYKKARDSETAEMVQLCLDASQVDLGSMYAFDYCGYDAIYVKVMLPNTYKFASYAAGTEKSLVGRIEKIEKAVQGGE